MLNPRPWISLLTVFALIVAPLPAFPQSPEAGAPLVSVAGFRGLDDVIERQFRTYLIDELAGSKRMRLTPDPVVAARADEIWSGQPKDANARLEEAYESYVKGKRLYEALDVDGAIKELSDAVRGYREGIGAVRDNRFLLASHLYLGMALVIRGNVTEGKEFIRQMVILDPERVKHRLPQKEFPPKIVALHTEVTREVLKAPVGAISLRTVPSGAEVYLDGVNQNPTPVDIANVPAGEHFVTAQKKGFGRFSQRVLVEAGKNAVEAKLEEWQPLAPYSQKKRSDPVFNDVLQKLGKDLGSPILLLGVLREAGSDKYTASAQLYDTRSREFSRVESAELDFRKIKKSAEVLSKKILSDLTVQGLVVAEINQDSSVATLAPETVEPRSPTLKETEEGARRFYQTWWFWTLVGAVAVGGAGLGIYMGRSDAKTMVLSIKNPLP